MPQFPSPLKVLTRFSLASFCALTLCLSAMASPEGQWQGAIQLPGMELQVKVKLQRQDGHWTGSIDIPQQKAQDLPLTEIQQEGEHLRFKIQGIPGNPTFEGQLLQDETQFKGTFTQGGQKFTFELNRPDSAKAQEALAKQQKMLQDWSQWLEKEMAKTGTPGVAVAIVQDDAVLFEKGFGWRDRQAQKPVTEDTVFAIGSTTKAFTATLLGMLVDEHRLDWDQPVQSYLPDFRLQDEYATAHMTPRDLLTHDSGLPRHDLSWYSSYASRDEIYHRLRYLEPSAELRQRFQYQNLMYMTAGILAEKITGESWESLVQERILKPLKMSRTTTSGPEARQEGNFARPYTRKQGEVKEIPFRDISAVGPAGSVHSSAKDMAQWLRFQLSGGKVDDQKLLSAATLKTQHSPQIIMSSEGQSPMIPYMLYGMGWMIHPYRGHTVIQHGGNIDGFTAQVGLLPEKNLGVVILSNQNGDLLPGMAMFSLFDKMLDLEPVDWSQRIDSVLKMIQDGPPKAKDSEIRVPNTHPSHALSAYAGSFAHPGYDNLELRNEGGQLRLHLGNLSENLEHWQYDTFRLKDGNSGVLDGMLIQFENNLMGDVDTLKIQLEPNVPPLLFTRQAEARFLEPDYLRQFAGTYVLNQVPIEVKWAGKVLVTHVPGQPDQELVPTAENRFLLKDETGFYLRFVLKGKEVEKVLITQPGGTFVAQRQKKTAQ